MGYITELGEQLDEMLQLCGADDEENRAKVIEHVKKVVLRATRTASQRREGAWQEAKRHPPKK